MSVEFARTIIGIIGNIISLILFLSPIPTFRKIVKQKAVEEFKPDPYLATLLNCAMWSFYGLPVVQEDSFLVTTINSVGLVIELIYVAIFFTYAPFHKRRKITIVLIFEMIIMMSVVLISIMVFDSSKKRAFFVGILCIILNIMMYTSPLTIMRMVIRTKSVKYMPIYLSLACLCNGLIWVTYAILKFDLFIVLPNGLGALSGMLQIMLYATYYKTTRWDDDDDAADEISGRNKPAEVQLSSEV